MTVEARVPKEFYEGNGANRAWPFYFPAMSEDHVKVGISRNDGGTDWLDSEGYEVDLAAGNVIYPLSGDPLPRGRWIAIVRETPIEQNLDLENVGNFYPESIEKGLDWRAFVEQEIREKLDRAVMVPPWVENPNEYGQGILSAAKRAENAADNAERSESNAKEEAKKAAESAEESRTAQKGSEKAQSESEAAAERAEVAMKDKLEPQDLIAGNNVVIEQGEDGKLTISSTAGEEGGTVTSVENIRPDKFGNVDLIEVNNEKRGLMTPIAKMKLDSLPEIPKPTDEDRGKTLVYKDNGSLAWEFNVVHHIGEIFAYGGSTPPVGAVECRGQTISKTTHPDLFEVIGYNFGGSGDLFYLPDTYTAARFLRSRSSSLPIGTGQGDAIRNITGTVRSGLTAQTGNTQSDGVFAKSYTGNGASFVYSTGGTAKDMWADFDASNVVPIAEENRPINLSVMYCIQITHAYVNPSQIDMSTLQNEILELQNKNHYPPMFISGFKIEYVNSSTIRVKAGQCRSEDNKANIEFTSPSGVLLNINKKGTFFIYAVLKIDKTVEIIAVEREEIPDYFENQLARRRVAITQYLSASGITPFIQTLKGSKVETLFLNHLQVFASTTSITTNTYVACPSGVTLDAKISIQTVPTDGGSGFIDVHSMINPNSIYLSTGRVTSGSSIFHFGDIPLAKENDLISVVGSLTIKGALYIRSLGWTDWRVD